MPLPADPSRIYVPAGLIRACWDAIADALPRTAGAEVAFGGPLFSDRRPHPAQHLAAQLLTGPGMAGTDETVVRLQVSLQGTGAPRLELGRLRAMQYEAQVALHRGSRRWKPLERVVSNGATVLTDAELEELLDAQSGLGEMGVEVELPEMQTAEVRRRSGRRRTWIGPSSRPTRSWTSAGSWRWALSV